MWLAICFRLGELYLPDARVTTVIGLTTVITVFLFVKLGLYRAVIRYLGQQVLVAVTIGVTVSVLALSTLSFLFQASIPRSVPLIYFAMAIVTVGGMRLLMRTLLNRQIRGGNERVIIYGAGSAGLQLANALAQGAEYRPVAFVDDDERKRGTVLQGLRVYRPSSLEHLLRDKSATQILLAIDNITPSQRAKITDRLNKLDVKVQKIPGFADIVSGKANIDELRQIEIEDLLGRDTVQPQKPLLEKSIKGKVVMVTGAGGSIGSELCRQIIQLAPRGLILFEMSEYALYTIDAELKVASKHGIKILPILGTVEDQPHLERVMRQFQVGTVFHAAAYKHVPLVEYNLIPGLRNNVFGTHSVVQAAINTHVKHFLLISTDKAVRPTNFMGATKRMAELIVQAAAARAPQTNFCMVRFGNVLGSSGSVVPLFKRQIEAGGPVTVTHASVTRYFMTIPEAVQLVIQANALSENGEVFVLDMGEPVEILKLAENMVRLAGKSIKDGSHPNGDIEILITGLRPGEKLYEELLLGDNCVGTEHPMITRALEYCLPEDKLEVIMQGLHKACTRLDHRATLATLSEAVPEYHASDTVFDYLDVKAGDNSENVLGFHSREI